MCCTMLAVLGLIATNPSAIDAAPTVVVHGAAHHGDVTGQEIAWSSSVLVRVEGDPERVRVPLARPLPVSVTLDVDPGVVVERDSEGRAVALVTPVSPLGYGGVSPAGVLKQLDVRARQPLPDEGSLTLHAPLPASAGVQRVSLAGATPLRFLPDEALGIERRIGRAVGVDVSRDERRRLDRWLERDGPTTAERLYLKVGPAVVERGLSGELERSPAQRAEVGVAAALLFGLLVAAGAWLYRRAARQAELDRVDAFLEDELRNFGK